VVAGRADEGEAALLDRLDRGAGGEQSGAVACGRGRRVGIEPGRLGYSPQALQVGGAVAAEDVLLRRLPCLAPGGEGGLKDGQSLWPLRVVAGGVEAGEVGVAYELDRRTASARVSRSAPPP
jgi:hypothetical protein